MTSLDDQEIAALDLGHDATKDTVDERIEGGVSDEVVGYVDEEPLVRRNRRGEGMKNIGERRDGAMDEIFSDYYEGY